jgi:exonuclease III
MKILSWNVRGLGDKEKRDLVQSTLFEHKPDIVCIQESKLSNIDSFAAPAS